MNREPLPASPIQPVALGLADRVRFRCHRSIACFNRCCENTDIVLAPYDILRLKRRLGLTSREFIDRYTRDCALDAHGMPGLKLGHKPGGAQCVFLAPEGCTVYEDRPSACRYYPLGQMSVRRKDSAVDEEVYFVVREPHCLGHEEAHAQTIAQYRREQGLERYDEANRDWRRLILKKRSLGPAIGRPSQRSFELFFLACYDVDGFRAFVASDGFRRAFDMPEEEWARLESDDEALLAFGLRLLRQALFGERTVPVRAQAEHESAERWKRKQAERVAQAQAERERRQDELYEALLDEDRHGGAGEA